MICVGLIGFGYWGPNLARNFLAAGAKLAAVCDRDPRRLELARRFYPAVKLSTDPSTLFADPSIDAVLIATPASTHYPLTLAALRAGKRVWLEKPMAQSLEECAQLVNEAERRNLVLMVDYPYVFHPAVVAVRDLIHRGEMGELHYYDSVRINLGRFQQDVDVLGDLASHDLSILDFLISESPLAVAATGTAPGNGEPHSLAYLTFYYPHGFLAHIHVNWVAPCKIRRAMVTGTHRMVLWDDLLSDEKLKIYEHDARSVDFENDIEARRIGFRTGKVYSPRLDVAEPLQLAANHFIECVTLGQKPLTSGDMNLRIALWLDLARTSLAEGGRPVDISPFHSQLSSRY